VLRQFARTGFTVPLFESLRRNLALDEELRELAALRLALEWHVYLFFAGSCRIAATARAMRRDRPSGFFAASMASACSR